jgi:hypothetical protein
VTLARPPVDAAFVAMLHSVFDPQTISIYWGKPPDPNAALPYVVVYGIPGGTVDGPFLTDPEAYGEFLFQTTCVGGTPDQADWLDAAVRAAVVGRTPTGDFATPLPVTGWSVMNRATDGGTSGAIQSGLLWQTTPRYAITVST